MTAYLDYHIRKILSRTFFKSSFDISKMLCRCHFLSVSATRLLYHKFSRLSTVNLNFLKTNLFFSISEAIPCDSLFILPLPQGEVKHFLQKVSYFLYKILLQLGAYIYPTFQPLTISLIHDSVTLSYNPFFHQEVSLCIKIHP